MRALVTGANGFLGRHVVDALLARGIEVRALVRPAAHLEALGWPSSVDVFRADLRSSRELRRAFEGVDMLLHLAAVVSGGEDAQFAGTVGGTERLLEAMATSCLPAAGAVQHLLGLRLQLDPPDPRRGFPAPPSARRLQPRRLHHREVVAGASDAALRREVWLGPHRASAWLYLGTRSRVLVRHGSAVWAALSGDRPDDSHADDPRGELCQRLRSGGGGRTCAGSDL